MRGGRLTGVAALAASLVPAVAVAAVPGGGAHAVRPVVRYLPPAFQPPTTGAVAYLPPAYAPPAAATVAYLPPRFPAPVAHTVAYLPPAYAPPAPQATATPAVGAAAADTVAYIPPAPPAAATPAVGGASPDTVAYLPPAYAPPAPDAVAYIPPAYQPPAADAVAYLPPAYAPPPGQNGLAGSGVAGSGTVQTAAADTQAPAVAYIPPAYVAPQGQPAVATLAAAQEVAYLPPAYRPPAGGTTAGETTVGYIPPAYQPFRQLAAAQPVTDRSAARQSAAFQPKLYPQVFHPAKAVYYPRWEWCVPFARDVSGIKIIGNAKDWWYNAAGHYARGHRPEPGAVLDFRGIARMPLGHVSVVMSIVNTREILIEHANWGGPGSNHSGISRNIVAIDVSPNNDWTAVRVGLGPHYPGQFGSVYPTYGFIYDRPDNGAILANTHPAPTVRHVEVAEAPPAAPVASRPLHHSLLDMSIGNK